MKVSDDIFLVYAITNDRWEYADQFYEQVEDALRGGITCLQYRDKIRNREEIRVHAKVIQSLCHWYGVPLLMNDDVELAKELETDGVHIGQADMDIEEARTLLGPDSIIGVSARTVEQAECAQIKGADYLGAGAVFQTATKIDAKPLSHETLKAISLAVDIPVVAIGGITIDNLHLLTDTGIAGVATVSAIFGEDNIQVACRRLKEVLSGVVRSQSFDSGVANVFLS